MKRAPLQDDPHSSEPLLLRIDKIIAISDYIAMKMLRYAPDALRGLRRHRNMAARLRSKIDDYIAGRAMPGSVKVLTTGEKRLRLGDFRILFFEDDTTVTIFDIAPRGNIYRD